MVFQSPALNRIQHLKEVVEWEIHSMKTVLKNMQEFFFDAVMSTCTIISKECLEYPVESRPPKTEAVQRAKGVPTQY